METSGAPETTEVPDPQTASGPGDDIAAKLRTAGLRSTRQRRLLARLLFSSPAVHVTAASLGAQLRQMGVRMSRATVYNCLNAFTSSGLLKRLTVDGGPCFYDTNTLPHHHFCCREEGRLFDIAASGITIRDMPPPPDGYHLHSVSIVVNISAGASVPAGTGGTADDVGNRLPRP